MELKYTDTKILKSVEFEDYLKIDAFSFSTLKQIKNGVLMDFYPTDKVRVGKIVDDIITNKGKNIDISSPLYIASKDISNRMLAEFGSILKYIRFQDSFTSTIEFDGFSLNVKGRPDARLEKRALIDFKVNNDCKTKEDCEKLISYMMYDCQIFHYSRMSLDPNSYILMYCTKVKKTFFIKMFQDEKQLRLAEDWWVGKVLEHGFIK